MQLALGHDVDASPFVYVGGLEKLRPNFELGKSQVNLKKKMAPWGTHWASLRGRITLRLAAIGAAGHVEVLDYFFKEWKVPVNSIPADENVEPVQTPLVAAVMADKEDVARQRAEEEGKECEKEKMVGDAVLKVYFSLPPDDRADFCSMMEGEDAQYPRDLERKVRRGMENLDLSLLGPHGPALSRQHILSMAPEERAELYSTMDEEDVKYIEGVDAMYHHAERLVEKQGPAARRFIEEEIERYERGGAEDIALSRPPKSGKRDAFRVPHGRASSPKPAFWSMPLFLLASLAFFYFFATNQNKRAAGSPGRARIIPCRGNFRWVPLNIFLLHSLYYPDYLQAPRFLDPVLTLLLSWLPTWFLWFGYFIVCLAVAFEERVAEGKDKVWSACSVLCPRIKRKWDGRNRDTKLAVEAVARQQEDRGTQKKEKQQGKNGRKKGNRCAPPEVSTNKHSTPRDAKPQEPEAEHDESVAPTEGKNKTNKKNKEQEAWAPAS